MEYCRIKRAHRVAENGRKGSTGFQSTRALLSRSHDRGDMVPVSNMNQTTIDAGRFDVTQIASTLPETATTLLVDHYLTNREAALYPVYKNGLRSQAASAQEILQVVQRDIRLG